MSRRRTWVNRTRARKFGPPLTALLVAGGVSSRAAADDLKFRKLPLYKNVVVLTFETGHLRFRLTGPVQRVLEKRVTDLEWVRITGESDLNRAEQYVVNGNDRAAIPLYERAVRATNRSWQKSLVRVRLIGAYDRVGQFDEAVENYIRLLEELGTGAAVFRPTRLPARGSRFHAVALRRIDSALATSRTPGVLAALQSLRKAIVAKTESPRRTNAEARVKDRVPTAAPAVPSRDVVAERVAAIEVQIRQGRHAEAKAALGVLLKLGQGARRATLLRLSAEVGVATAEDDDALLAAGVDAMRVVVGFPSSTEVPAALYWAAVVHERIGRLAVAVALLHECKAHNRTSVELAARVDAMLARLANPDEP